MCLTTKKCVPSVTKKDIVVYKVIAIDNNFCGKGVTRMVAPIIGMQCYDFNKTYHEAWFNDWDHFAVTVKRFAQTKKGYRAVEWQVKYGYHAFRTKKSACVFMEKLTADFDHRRHFSVVRCVIPADSQYFNGENNEICSNRIMLEKIVA